eukprot:1782293-Prymnesium_polylepis.3
MVDDDSHSDHVRVWTGITCACGLGSRACVDWDHVCVWTGIGIADCACVRGSRVEGWGSAYSARRRARGRRPLPMQAAPSSLPN